MHKPGFQDNNGEVRNFLLYNLDFGFSCFIIVSATIRRWILPVAVLGMLSVK